MELLDQVFFTYMIFFIACLLIEKCEVFAKKSDAGDVNAAIGIGCLIGMFICLLIKIWQ